MEELIIKDLKPGMYVELKNGLSGVLIPWKGNLSVVGYDRNTENKMLAILTVNLRFYNGKIESTHDNYSIIAVYNDHFMNHGVVFSTAGRKLLWKYENEKEMTVSEIEKILGFKIKIVGE